MLIAQHFQHRLILFFGELIRITDAQLWLRGFDEQRGIRNVDRAIISLYPAFIALAVRQILLNKNHLPAIRRRREGFSVVHQQVRPPLVRCAVNFAANVKPVAFNHARIERFPVGNQGGINWLHAFAHNQTQRGIAGCRNQIVTPFGHQTDHFIGSRGGFNIHRAACLFFELRYPVVLFISLSAFDVSRPGDNIQSPFRIL